MALAPNTRIDHYAIAAPVGAGGMGIVYAGAFVFARSEARRELDPETQKVAGIEREASRFADHSTESLRGSLRSVALVLELQGLPEEPSRVIVRDLPEADRVRPVGGGAGGTTERDPFNDHADHGSTSSEPSSPARRR